MIIKVGVFLIIRIRDGSICSYLRILCRIFVGSIARVRLDPITAELDECCISLSVSDVIFLAVLSSF